MKTLIISILLLFCISQISGQNNVENTDSIEILTDLTIDFDLSNHWWWKHYLQMHNKKSIAKENTIDEGYRLLYSGNYFSIVEILKREDLLEIIVDSVPINNNKLYRTTDSLKTYLKVENIRGLCERLINESNKENSYIYEIHDDDRDNWAFEFKIDNQNYVIEGIEVSKEFAEIIKEMMDIGSLTNYTIYDRMGGKFN